MFYLWCMEQENQLLSDLASLGLPTHSLDDYEYFLECLRALPHLSCNPHEPGGLLYCDLTVVHNKRKAGCTLVIDYRAQIVESGMIHYWSKDHAYSMPDTLTDFITGLLPTTTEDNDPTLIELHAQRIWFLMYNAIRNLD